MYLRCIFSFFLFFLVIPLWVYGQNSQALTTVPSFPEAGQVYTASVSPLSGTIASIRWFVNGKEEIEAKNSRSITLTAKGLGVSERISVDVTSDDGQLTQASKTITPVRTDMVVTADTVAPAFYKGRKLGSGGSEITTTALVFLGSPKETGALTYLWKVGNKVQNGGIPSAQNTVTFESGFEDELLVGVSVYKNNKLITEKTILVPMSSPELHFYEKNLLRGLSTLAMKNPHIFIGEELLFRAESYFVDQDLGSPDILRTWKINNRTVAGNANDPYEITLEKQGGSGVSQISFSLKNMAKLLQGVSGGLGVQF